MDIFEAKHYKQFLLKRMPTTGNERGLRSKLADFLGCQLSFISLVLTTQKHHFSPEHGFKICNFFNLSESEAEFFILLLSKERAGSKELEGFYQKQIKDVLKRREEINSRIKDHSTLNKNDQALYYSDWYYTAIHMILRSRADISPRELASLLGLSLKKVHECLSFLIQVGIISKHKNHYTVHDIRIHAGEESHWLNTHHKNWRNRAVLSLDDKKEEDIHYTMITSISREAAVEMRKKILKMINENEVIIREAKDEEVHVMNIDFFNLC